ncbi:MAG: septum site-determining protein Ssd [Micromonosporaceae bacterium]
MTADELLLDHVLRLAAIAGVEFDVAPDPTSARTQWAMAPSVIVGQDMAMACVRARLPRRRDVTLVAANPTASASPSGSLTPGSARAGVAPDVLAAESTVPTASPATPSETTWALAGELGADQVVMLPEAEAWLVRRLAESTRTAATGRIIAVAPGSGGAGASVLAAGLAVTAARDGARPMLVDADPLGGGLDVLLGWEERAGLRWPDLADASGAMSVDGLYSALPGHGGLVLLSWDRSDALGMPERAIDAVLDAGRRGSDLVVVDLPRQLDDVAVRVLQASDLVLLVVRPDVRGCAAASRVSAAMRLHCAEIEAVVRGPAPGNLRPRDVSRTLGMALAGSLRPESGLPAALDRGEMPAAAGRGPLAALCRSLLGRLEIKTREVA